MPVDGMLTTDTFTAWRSANDYGHQYGYALLTAVSPTELRVTISDPLSGAVVDESRVMQAPWPTVSPARPPAPARGAAAAAPDDLTIILCVVLIPCGLAAAAIVARKACDDCAVARGAGEGGGKVVRPGGATYPQPQSRWGTPQPLWCSSGRHTPGGGRGALISVG